MLRDLRERVKRSPLIGPPLYSLYLKTFRNEGEILRISHGPLAGKNWVRFMRTYTEEYVDGSYEKPVQQALAKHLKPGMVFYDVGANGGFYSLLGAELVGPKGRVIAFEPHPQTARCCLAQMVANGLKNVTVVAAAVSDKIGTDKLSDGDYSGIASLKDAATAARTVTVKTTTLDHEITKRSIPDVLKIDVEGSEIDALRGAADLISKNKPIFVVEVHSLELAAQYDELMGRYGYQTFSLRGERISVAKSGERFVVSTARGADNL
jgi:FkbM family methyltransferase